MNDITKPSEYLGYWGEKYKNDLLTDILPFWLKYGIDHENGGYFTCLDRDGSLLDTNKSVWFQGRFAFILAYAYNNLEKRAEWLVACKNGTDFIENTAVAENVVAFNRHAAREHDAERVCVLARVADEIALFIAARFRF